MAVCAVSFRQRFMSFSRLPPALILVIAIGTTGCRTYGDYGSEEKTTAKIAEVNEAFARSFERAQVDLEAFRRAAAGAPVLGQYADRYGEVVSRHGEMLDEHARAFERLGGGISRYLAASRLLRAIMSEQNLIAQRYAEVVRAAAGAIGIEVRDEPRPPDNYVHVPAYYERLRYQIEAPTLDAVLRAAG